MNDATDINRLVAAFSTDTYQPGSYDITAEIQYLETVGWALRNPDYVPNYPRIAEAKAKVAHYHLTVAAIRKERKTKREQLEHLRLDPTNDDNRRLPRREFFF